MENPFSPNYAKGNKPNNKFRPDILTALCILTFIGSGLVAFSYMSVLLSYDMMFQMVDNGEIKLPGIEILFSGGKGYFLLGFILYLVSIWGAVLMFRLKKVGFHLYTAAQLFLLILPLSMLSDYQFSVLELATTLAFIVFYYVHLKYMN